MKILASLLFLITIMQPVLASDSLHEACMTIYEQINIVIDNEDIMAEQLVKLEKILTKLEPNSKEYLELYEQIQPIRDDLEELIHQRRELQNTYENICVN